MRVSADRAQEAISGDERPGQPAGLPIYNALRNPEAGGSLEIGRALMADLCVVADIMCGYIIINGE